MPKIWSKTIDPITLRPVCVRFAIAGDHDDTCAFAATLRHVTGSASSNHREDTETTRRLFRNESTLHLFGAAASACGFSRHHSQDNKLDCTASKLFLREEVLSRKLDD